MIEVGKLAPAFTLQDKDGNKHSLREYRGKKVILYFYPKDNTPGCTIEAKDFRDNIAGIRDKNAVVLGVSPDGAASHQKFIEKFTLPFVLLSDPDKRMMANYGAWGEKNMYGIKRMGVIRSTVLVDEEGIVIKHFPRVQARGHVEKVLEFLS
jgi:thioredoxin-dependent peroxiredoxin